MRAKEIHYLEEGTKIITPPEDEQAKYILNPLQGILAVLFLIALAACLYYDWRTTFVWGNGILAIFYITVTLYKIVMITASACSEKLIRITPQEIASLDDSTLPRYSILVPLFHEGAVLPRLIQGLSEMDYPKDKLEILMLMEEDDTETNQAFETIAPPAHFRRIRIKRSYPHTKPKACDIGLAQATGDYLVIYDAEDRPEPDQLKKAVIGFRQCPEEVVCLQAKLNFYNRNQNIMSKWFTTEYSMWYDLFLPGLSQFDAPIPLGGTSNHFQMQALKELGGWDPYNVAEDCDLGIRLYKRGMRTRVLDSTTWEEACSHVGSWIRQRSRWIKGYMQTYFVHMRHPVRVFRQLGLRGFLHFILLTKCMFLTYLINPFYWILALIWLAFRPAAIGEFFPLPVFFMGFFCLFLGNFALIYGNMLGCARRGYYSLIKWALLIPPYWVLISIGAWKAAWQLITKPHYWEKTKHGTDAK